MAKRESQQNVYYVTLVFPKDRTKVVTVKAATREVAENRALKRNPTAIDIKA